MRPIDPDIDVHVGAQRRELPDGGWPILAAISAGGVIGGLARHGLEVSFVHPVTGFPWVTFGINVSGSLLIGVVMVLVTEVWRDARLLRPFLGVGVLGGFTTFSTYLLDIQQGVAAGGATIAVVYLTATVLAALAAVWSGAAFTGWAVRTSRGAGS